MSYLVDSHDGGWGPRTYKIFSGRTQAIVWNNSEGLVCVLLYLDLVGYTTVD